MPPDPLSQTHLQPDEHWPISGSADANAATIALKSLRSSKFSNFAVSLREREREFMVNHRAATPYTLPLLSLLIFLSDFHLGEAESAVCWN